MISTFPTTILSHGVFIIFVKTPVYLMTLLLFTYPFWFRAVFLSSSWIHQLHSGGSMSLNFSVVKEKTVIPICQLEPPCELQ